jgi:hypothetical protein
LGLQEGHVDSVQAAAVWRSRHYPEIENTYNREIDQRGSEFYFKAVPYETNNELYAS